MTYAVQLLFFYECADGCVWGLFYQWLQFMSSLRDDDVPQTISTSYGEDEQTGENQYFFPLCYSSM